jgi:hypothetical protein
VYVVSEPDTEDVAAAMRLPSSDLFLMASAKRSLEETSIDRDVLRQMIEDIDERSDPETWSAIRALQLADIADIDGPALGAFSANIPPRNSDAPMRWLAEDPETRLQPVVRELAQSCHKMPLREALGGLVDQLLAAGGDPERIRRALVASLAPEAHGR